MTELAPKQSSPIRCFITERRMGVCVNERVEAHPYVCPQVQSCNVTGLWRNELGSALHVQAVGSDLTGVYQTKVGTSSQESGPDQRGKLVGVVSHYNQQTSVAFSVLWETGRHVLFS